MKKQPFWTLAVHVYMCDQNFKNKNHFAIFQLTDLIEQTVYSNKLNAAGFKAVLWMMGWKKLQYHRIAVKSTFILLIL